MFKFAGNEEIGKYIEELIGKQYKSVRQFGKAYIEEEGGIADEVAMQRMSNRLSPIINGKNAIQIHDLPFFTKLLGVSCEEILSAGKCFAETSNHLTNYSIAFSKDERVWEEYVQREDKLILNADEYGKTVIDYALEFQNYELLKYLMVNKYIWFVGADKKDYDANFGAGTSIGRKTTYHTNMNVLECRLLENYEIRIKMIVLAIKRGDIKVLTELRAREIPSLYQASYLSCAPVDCEKYYDKDLLNAIANASDDILEYFSEEFEITDRIGCVNKFMFPFMSELIDLLIQCNNDYVEWLLKDAISHNENTYTKLKKLINNTINSNPQEYLECEVEKNDIMKGIIKEVDFYDNGNLISYRDRGTIDGIITNIIRSNATSTNNKTNRLIRELNDSYNKICNIKNEFLTGE